jgi:hypothetical protein
MKKLSIACIAFSLAGCSMTAEEVQQLNASLQNLNQASQGWTAQWNQIGQQYSGPQVVSPYGANSGVTYTPVGNSLIGSNGVTYRKVGSSIIGSDGTSCQIVGSSLVCR